MVSMLGLSDLHGTGSLDHRVGVEGESLLNIVWNYVADKVHSVQPRTKLLLITHGRLEGRISTAGK